MAPSEIVIRVDRKAFIAAAAIFLISAAAVRLWSESLTLVTTYPSPSGIYNQIVTTGNSGATPADTTLNRNAGNTILVPATNAGGKVGIGTAAPAEKLDVNGGLRVGATSGSSAGTIRFQAGQFEGHNGTAWGPLGGGGFWGASGSGIYNTNSNTAAGSVGIGTSDLTTYHALTIMAPYGGGIALVPPARGTDLYMGFYDSPGPYSASKIMGQFYASYPNKYFAVGGPPNGNLILGGGTNTVWFRDVASGGTTSLCYYRGLGSSAYAALSDCSSSRRYKDEIKPLPVDPSRVFKLEPVSFRWKTGGGPGVGLIAEDVAKALPEIVTYKDGKPEGVEYKLLSVYLLEIGRRQDASIRELKAENDRQEKELTALKRELDARK